MAAGLLDFERQMPREQMCPRLARLPANQALTEISALLDAIFGPYDVRSGKVKLVIECIRIVNLKWAGYIFPQLDSLSKARMRFAFEIYGMTLVTREPPPRPPF